MKEGLRMAGNWLALQVDPPRQFNKETGIHIPDTAQRLDDLHTATVMGVGPGYPGAPITDVKPHDRVLFQSSHGRQFTHGDKTYMAIQHSALVQIIPAE